MEYKKLDFSKIGNIKDLLDNFQKVSDKLVELNTQMETLKTTGDSLAKSLRTQSDTSVDAVESTKKLIEIEKQYQVSQQREAEMLAKIAELEQKIIEIQKKQVDENKKAAKDIEAEYNRRVASMEQLTKTIEEQKKQLESLDTTTKEGKKAYIALENELKKNERQYNKLNSAQEKAQKAQEKEQGTINQLNKLIAEQTKRRNSLNLETEEGRKEFEALTKELAENIKRQKELNEQVGRFQLNVGNYKSAFDGLTGIFAKVGAIGAAIGGAIAAVSEYVKVLNETAKIQKQVNFYFNTTGEELKQQTAQVKTLSRVLGSDYNETLIAANALSKEFGISGTEALNLLQEGANKGANAYGDLLEITKEYSSQIAQTGLNADQFLSIVAQANQLGFYDDKFIDSIKEGGIQFREFTKSVEDSLAPLGKMRVEQIKQLTQQGKTFEAMQYTAKSIKELGLTAQQTQGIISTIFVGAGEDAGQRFLETLENINGNLSDIPASASDADIATQELYSIWDELVVAFTDSEGIFSQIWTEFLKGAGAALKVISEVITKMNEFGSFRGIFVEITDWVTGGSYSKREKELINLFVKQNEQRDNIKGMAGDVEKLTALQTKYAGVIDELRKKEAELKESSSIADAAKLGNVIALRKAYEKSISVVSESIKKENEAAKAKMAQEAALATEKKRQEAEEKKADEERKKKLADELKRQKAFELEKYNTRKKFGLITKLEIYKNELQDLQKARKSQIITEQEYLKLVQKLYTTTFGEIQQIQNSGKKAGGITKGQIANIEKGIQTKGADKTTGDFTIQEKIAGALNIDDSRTVDEVFSFATQGYEMLTDAATNYYSYKAELVQNEIDLRQANIDSLQEQIDAEQALLDESVANGEQASTAKLDALKKQLTDEQKAKDTAQKEADKIAKKQFALDQIEKASALTVTIANIYKGFSKIPILGVVLGAAAVASFLAQFNATRKQITQEKAKKGLYKKLDGKSHDNGGINLGESNIEAEGGEGMAIYSKPITTAHGKSIEKMTNLINSGILNPTEIVRGRYSRVNNMNLINLKFDKERLLPELQEQTQLLRKMNEKNNVKYV